MLYYSNKARQSHINSIDKLMKKVASIPENVLDYTSATSVIRYLADYKSLIETEIKQNKEVK